MGSLRLLTCVSDPELVKQPLATSTSAEGLQSRHSSGSMLHLMGAMEGPALGLSPRRPSLTSTGLPEIPAPLLPTAGLLNREVYPLPPGSRCFRMCYDPPSQKCTYATEKGKNTSQIWRILEAKWSWILSLTLFCKSTENKWGSIFNFPTSAAHRCTCSA